MFLYAARTEGGAGTIIAPLGSALALVPKFNGFNIPLAEWEERVEIAAHLYQVPTLLILEDEVCQVVMTLPEKDWATLEQIVTRLEGLFGENMMILS